MSFSIHFLDSPHEYPFDDPFIPAARAVIILNDFREEFLASLAVWSQDQYQRQWKQALINLLKGEQCTALITEYYGDHERSSNLVWWPLYRQADTILVHNNLLFFDQLIKPFDLNEPEASIGPRLTQGEDGNTISEWCIPLGDVQAFVAELT